MKKLQASKEEGMYVSEWREKSINWIRSRNVTAERIGRQSWELSWVIKTIFHMFQRVEETISMLRRNMEHIKRLKFNFQREKI